VVYFEIYIPGKAKENYQNSHDS